jgi:hypothetical protein
MKVFINGEEVKYQASSLTVEWQSGLRAIARFKVIDTEGTLILIKGMQYQIKFNDDTLLLAGVIEKPTFTLIAPSIDKKLYDITGLDNRYFADKRLISASYQNTLAGDIVRDIFTAKMAEENITIGEIQDGPLITETVFNQNKVGEAFDMIANKTGMTWYIANDKKLYFVERVANPAPWTLTEDEIKIEGVGAAIPKLDTGNLGFRNRQTIDDAKDITTEQEAIRSGDGQNRTFLVDYDLAFEPTIEISLNNGPFTAISPSDIGILGLEEGKKWYWKKGERFIYQAETETVLEAVDRVRVLYKGYYEISVTVSDFASIDALAAIEGGSGIVEAVDNHPELGSFEAALETAIDELIKNSSTGYKLSFSTLTPGLLPGQLLPVNLPRYGITGLSFLIDKVVFRDYDVCQIYNVECSYGYISKAWTRLFTDLIDRSKPIVIRENVSASEVVRLTANFSKTWLEEDSPNIFTELYFNDDLYFSENLYFAFDSAERVRYVEAFDAAGMSLGRKYLTSQSQTDTAINTRFFISNTEFNGEIFELAWYGGYFATTESESGIEIDRQSYVHTKTTLEVLTINREDLKGW